MKLIFASILLTALLGAAPATQSTGSFHPGEVWLDDQGVPINCHGGGFLFHDGVCYWFGEHKTTRKATGHIGVGCYSSTDLYHWKSNGIALSAGAPEGDLVDGCVIERPKVIYNAKTKKFVMWFHLELKSRGYAAARAAVAFSDTATGPYTYVGSFRPNAGIWPINFAADMQKPLEAGEKAGSDPDKIVRRDFAGGQMSRDMTLFVDDDGAAYQIYASEENLTTQISRLSDDYLRPAGKYARALVGKSNEAASLFKRNGKYHLITSGTSGWEPNAARLAVADHTFGPWKSLGNPFVGPKDQTDLSFKSQAACVLSVAGKPDAFIYVGDRWKPRDLPDSRYIWLPISFVDDRVEIAWKDRWDLSVFDTRAQVRSKH